MLTRLKVSGFKNLVDLDVRFGAFTCLTGDNGVGKSNLFDAIQFLSALANYPFTDAAQFVRGGGEKGRYIRSLFYRQGDRFTERMFFEAEIIIPQQGIDHLGQKAEASSTSLRYSLELVYKENSSLCSSGSLELVREELTRINSKDASKYLLFDHQANTWGKSVIKGRGASPLISTKYEASQCIIRLHRDGRQGGFVDRLAQDLPRTVLSATDAAFNATAYLAKQEMCDWKLFHFEPASLRQPNEFANCSKLQRDGYGLAAALYDLALAGGEDNIYSLAANQLSKFIVDLEHVWVERDECRGLLTIVVQTRDGTIHSACSLPASLLRLLALVVLQADRNVDGLLCFEEPENGIDLQNIPKMVQLLQVIAVDVNKAIGSANPLRQVMISTHSSAVVQHVSDHSLLVARLQDIVSEGKKSKQAYFSCLSNTWRDKEFGGKQSKNH